MLKTITSLEAITGLLSDHSSRDPRRSVDAASMGWQKDTAICSYIDSLEPENRGAEHFRMHVFSIDSTPADSTTAFGKIVGGEIRTDDDIMVAATLKRGRVRQITTADGTVSIARSGDMVNLQLHETMDFKEGDLLHRPGETLQRSDQFRAHLLWMHADPMLPERSYHLKIGSQTTSVQVTDLKYTINFNQGEHLPATKLNQHEIAVCNFATAQAIAFDHHTENAETGTFVLIDRINNDIVAAGLIDFGLHRGQNLSWQSFEISRNLRAQMKNQKPLIIWFTGLSASGKSTIADMVEQKLAAQNRHTYLLDGDNFRHGLNKDLGFTDADRVENIRRVAEVARLMADSGLIVMASFISPFRRERRMAREIAGDINFVEVFVDTPLEVCEARDPKGMYAKARRGEIPNFTGISSAYEAPELADIHLEAGERTSEELADQVLHQLDFT